MSGKNKAVRSTAVSTLKRADTRGEGLRRSIISAGVLLSFALLAHGIFGANGLLTLRQKHHEYDAIQRQIQQLKQENQGLQQQVQGLKSNPATIGRYAREELHMARPGEVIYVLSPQDQQGSASAAANSAPKAFGSRRR